MAPSQKLNLSKLENPLQNVDLQFPAHLATERGLQSEERIWCGHRRPRPLNNGGSEYVIIRGGQTCKRCLTM